MRLGIVGDGRAARALVPRWEAAGHVVAWQQRRHDAVPLGARPAVDVVILAVRDGELDGVAQALGDRPGAVAECWLHLSGVTPGLAIRRSQAVPRACGALHPLVALAGASGTGPLGAFAGLDGDPEAVVVAHALAAACGLTPVVLAERGAKALYHAAAVTVAGHATALFAQGLQLMGLAGLSQADAHPALLALMRSTVENLALGPPERVVTGPVARGDLETVSRHLAALGAASEDIGLVYRALAREAVALSSRGGGLDPETAERLLGLLAAGATPPQGSPPTATP